MLINCRARLPCEISSGQPASFCRWQPLKSAASITWNAVVASQKLSVKRPRMDGEIARHLGRLDAILTEQRADYRQPDSAVLAFFGGLS